MLRRFLERRSLFAPDRSHFHHRLLEMGLNQRRAVTIIYLTTAAAAGLGLFMMIRDDASALLVFAVVLCLIVLLFRVVGAVRLDDTLAHLQSKHKCTLEARHDKKAFEHLQLQFRQVHDAGQWWQTVCAAAERMDFVWVSLKTTGPDGRVEEELWRAPGAEPSRESLVTMSIPLRSAAPDRTVHLELAIARNGSLEATGRRTTLFARLLDENGAIVAKRAAAN